MVTRQIRNTVAIAALIVAFSSIGSASAAEYEVKMLNKGPDHMMQFDPELLKIAPGDTVHFVATDKGHSVETVEGMIPDGAEPFFGNIGQDVSITLKAEGVYGFQCRPHGGMGMVGMIVVGHPANEDAAKGASVPGLAKRNFAKLFQALDSRLAAGD
jgi:pseudoazurin